MSSENESVPKNRTLFPSRRTEIEHFCDPTDKSHPKFDEVRDVQVNYRVGDITKLVKLTNPVA